MRYFEISEAALDEAPIENFGLVGDWNKSSSFRDPKDRKLLTNPRAQQQIIHKWKNTTVPFNLYFINSPEASHHSEVGEVNMEWLEKNMPKTLPQIVLRDDAVNVLFTNNKGDERVPLTGWVMGHRLGHALARYGGGFRSGRQVEEFTYARNLLIRAVKDILSGYGYPNAPGSEKALDNSRVRGYDGRPPSGPNYQNLYRDFYMAIGTMSSARTGNLRNEFEFLLELLAQYITTRKIKFNPAPQSFATGKAAWGRKDHAYLRSGHDLQDVNDELEVLATDLENAFQEMLDNCVGRTFVM